MVANDFDRISIGYTGSALVCCTESNPSCIDMENFGKKGFRWKMHKCFRIRASFNSAQNSWKKECVDRTIASYIPKLFFADYDIIIIILVVFLRNQIVK